MITVTAAMTLVVTLWMRCDSSDDDGNDVGSEDETLEVTTVWTSVVNNGRFWLH